MTLAANKVRVFKLEGLNELPVAASAKIYAGSAVGDNGSGYMRALQAGDPFKGFAEALVDNSSGAAGALNVPLRDDDLVQLNVSGAAITDVDKPVFASDEDTFTLTQGSNSYVGRIYRWVSTGVVIVRFEPGGALSKVTELTDSSGGTADGTVAAMVDLATAGGNTYSDAALNAKLAIIRDNMAEMTTKINAIARQLK